MTVARVNLEPVHTIMMCERRKLHRLLFAGLALRLGCSGPYASPVLIVTGIDVYSCYRQLGPRRIESMSSAEFAEDQE